MDDEVGSLVEKLKPQFVTKWLKTVCDVRFDVMVMCLLPKPMEFARVRTIYLKAPLFATEIKVLSKIAFFFSSSDNTNGSSGNWEFFLFTAFLVLLC